jgi:hypothetical protein
MQSNKKTINICGDLFLSQEHFLSEPESMLGSVFNIFTSSQINIVNLEAPIATNNHKITKTGPHLKHSPEVVSFLKKSNINVVTLANNHILDYGAEGLSQTLQLLGSNSIDNVGAAEELESAQKSLKLSIGNLKISIINFCENEWSIATPNQAGANPLDIIENTKQIRKAKNDSDYVLVIIHGGHEYYTLPNPRMVKQYRYFAEIGADMIIGHHPHCYSGYEIYNNVPIFYSLGNFLFTLKSKYSLWYTGLILQIEIDDTNKLLWKLIPIQQSQIDFNLKILVGEEARNILAEIEDLSKTIENSEHLKNAWESYLQEKTSSYLNLFSFVNAISSRYLRGISNKTGLSKLLNTKRYLCYLLNMLRCESHNDISKEILNDYIRRK